MPGGAPRKPRREQPPAARQPPCFRAPLTTFPFHLCEISPTWRELPFWPSGARVVGRVKK
jgi:hypothetical protein